MQDKIAETPAHVPPELVVDVDIYAIPPGDAQLGWSLFERDRPLSWSPYNGGHWVATTAETVFRFYRDVEHFSSRQIVIPKIGDEDRMIPIQTDPPAHADYRRNILGLFDAAAVANMSDDVRAICVSMIEEIKGQPEVEFVQAFAFRFPLTIFLRMMGLPLEDRLYLRSLVERFSDSPDLAEKMAAHAELHVYIDKAIEDRLAHPRDDAVTMVTRSRIGDRPYTPQEMRATIQLLMAAGLDTVANLLGFITHYLAGNPGQANFVRANLDDKAVMHRVIQEFLRRFPIVNSSRILAKDYTYDGVTMKAGDMIILPATPFNLDEARGAPETLDFDRKSARHITFGSGPHACAGALLAREEIEIFLSEWLTRIPSFSLHPDRPAKMRALPLNAMSELWLKLS